MKRWGKREGKESSQYSSPSEIGRERAVALNKAQLHHQFKSNRQRLLEKAAAATGGQTAGELPAPMEGARCSVRLGLSFKPCAQQHPGLQRALLHTGAAWVQPHRSFPAFNDFIILFQCLHGTSIRKSEQASPEKEKRRL